MCAAVTSSGTSSEVFDVWLDDRKWADTDMTFSFPTSANNYGYSAPNFQVLSASQQTAVREIFDEISSFCGLTFTEITEAGGGPNEATLALANEIGVGGAYAYTPSTSERGGDSWYNPDDTADPVRGNEAFLYFTHEIGHALGLLHGHEYQSFIDSGFDSTEYTVVTYTDYVGESKNPNTPAIYSFDSGPIDWAQSYQQLDIAALQFLYGANFSATDEVWSGDTVYSFDPNTGEMSLNGVGQGAPIGNRIFRTIWDGHGNDTYDLSNYSTDLEIDLAPGAWSLFSTAQLSDPDFNSTNDPNINVAGNVANARLYEGNTGSLIENAIGGSGDDTISGNQANNNLAGNGGHDDLSGQSGDDTLLGGGQDDTLLGNGGDDSLRAGTGDDYANGGTQDDEVFGQSGDDTLLGANGDDALYGAADADVLKGGADNDTLQGGAGDDQLRGGDHKDVLRGGAGDDTLWGDAGADDLIGNAGADKMYGGTGNDRFVFKDISDSPESGAPDKIMDFQKGMDVIDLDALSATTFDFAALGAFTGLGPSVITREAGSNTRIYVDVDGDGQTDMDIRVIGVTGLSASDFEL